MAKIEERIVSMKFDNKQFKMAASETLSKLEQLKSGLKFDKVGKIFGSADKEIKAMAKSVQTVDFSNMSQQLDGIQKQWSVMGTVSKSAIDAMTKGVLGFATKGFQNAWNTVVTGGMNRARNLEQANFMLRGILKDSANAAAETKAIMEDANYAVTDTAFGLDSAAKAAAQFAANGMRAGKEMQSTLRGISGVASMTSSSYDEIAGIFTTVAGQGKLMSYQLNQLAFRGLNAASVLSKHFKVTEADLRDMVSKGKVSFEDFATAMDEAFGDQAKASNETFQGALSNMNAAFGRIGAKFATPYMEQMRDLFNSIRPAINAVNVALDPFINTLNKGLNQSVTTAIGYISKFTSALEAYNDPDKANPAGGWTKFFDFFNDLALVFDLVRTVGADMLKVLLGAAPSTIAMSKAFGSTGEKLQHIFRKLLSVLMLVPEFFGAILQEVFGLGEGFGSIGGSVLDIIDNLAGFLYLTAEFVRSTKIIQGFAKVVGFVARVIVTGFKLAFQAVSFFVDILMSVVEFFAPVTDVVKRITDGFESLHQAVKNFSLPDLKLRPLERLRNTVRSIVEWFKALGGAIGNVSFGIFDKLTEGISNVFKMGSFDFDSVREFANNSRSIVSDRLSGINVGGFKRSFGRVGSFATSAFDSIRSFDYRKLGSDIMSGIGSAFSWTGNKLIDLSAWVRDSVRSIDWPAIGNTFADGFMQALSFLVRAGGSTFLFLDEFFGNLFSAINWDKLLEGFTDAYHKITDSLGELKDVLAGEELNIDDSVLADTIGTANAEKTVTILTNARQEVLNIGDALKGAWENIKQTFNDTIGTDVFKPMADVIGTLRNPFKGVENGLTASSNSFVSTFTETLTKAFEGMNIADLLTSAGIFTSGLGMLRFADSFKGLTAIPKGLVDAIGAFGEAAKIGAKGKALRDFGIGVALIAAAIAGLAFIPWDKLQQGLIVMAGLMVAIGLFVLAMTKLNPVTDAAATAKLVAIAAVMLTIAFAIAALAGALALFQFISWDSLLKGLAILGGVAGSLFVLTKFSGGGLIAASFAIGMMAMSILVLASSLALLTGVGWDTVGDGLLKTAAMLLVFVTAARLLKGGGDMVGLGAGMLTIAAGLIALSYAMAFLNTVSWEELGQGLLRVAAVLAVMILATWALSATSGGGLKAAATLIVIATSLLVLAAAVAMLSALDVGSMVASLAMLSVFIGVFGLTMKSMDMNLKLGASFMMIAAALIVLAGAVFIMGSIPWQTALQGMLALVAFVSVFGLTMKSMGNMEGASKAIMSFAKAIAILAAIMVLLGVIDTQIVLDGAIALGIVVGILVLAFAGIGAVAKWAEKGLANLGKVLMAAGKAFILFAAAVAILVGAMWLAALIPADQFEQAVAAVVISILALTFAVGVMMVMFSKFGKTAMPGALALLAVAGAVLVLVAAMWLLNALDMEDMGSKMMLLALGVLAMAAAATILGTISGAIMPGVIALAAIGGAILILVLAVRLLEGIGWEDVVGKIAALAGGLLLLGAAAAILGVGMAIIGPGALILLALALATVVAAAGVWLLVAAFRGLEGIDGAGITQNIKDMAGGLLLLALASVGIGLASPFLILAGLGLVVIAAGIAALGGALNIAASALEKLPTLSDNLGRLGTIIGGAKDFFTRGKDDINAAADEMDVAAERAKESAKKLESPEVDTTKTASVGQDLGNNLLTGFQDGVGAGIDQDLIMGSLNLDSLSTGMDLGVFEELGANIPDSIGTGATEGMGNLSTDISGMMGNLPTELEGGLNADMFSNLGSMIPEGMGTGVEENKGQVTDSAQGAVNDAATGTEETARASFQSVGRAITDGMAAGITSGPVAEKARQVAREAKAAAEAELAINSPSRVFRTIGNQVVNGLALGLSQDKASRDAAAGMARNVTDTTNSEFDIHSPSRVFYGIGMNLNAGLAGGIADYAYMPIDALDALFVEMGGTIEKGMSNIDKAIILAASANPLTGYLSEVSSEARKTRKDQLAQRAKDAKEENKRLEDQLYDAEKAFADYEDSLLDAQDGISDTTKEISELKGETKSEDKAKKKEKRTAEETAKQNAEDAKKLTKAERDLAKKKRDLDAKRRERSDKLEAIEKAKQERVWYDANVQGYLAGQAFAEGTESGLKDADEVLKTENELFVDILSEKVNKTKENIENVRDAVGSLKEIGSIFKNTTTALRDFERAFKRLNASTTDRAAQRNMGIMLDSVLAIGDELVKVVELYDRFEPFLVQGLNMMDRVLPSVLPMITQFAPAIGAQLSQGLLVALPQIVGAAGGIIAAVAGIALFLYDMGKDQKILGFLKKMVDGIIKFISQLPQKIFGILTTMIKGLGNFLKEIPKWIPEIINGLINGILFAIQSLPEAIGALLEAIVEVLITLFTSPQWIVEMIVAIVGALLEAIPKIAQAILTVFFKLGTDIIGAIVKGIVGSVKGAIVAIGNALQTIVDSIAYILNPFQWGKTPPWKKGGGGSSTGGIGGTVKIDTVDPNIFRTGNTTSQVDTSKSVRTANDVLEAQMSARNASSSSSNTTINYTQHNTSPQPLNAIQIYRNTDKQLSMIG